MAFFIQPLAIERLLVQESRESCLVAHLLADQEMATRIRDTITLAADPCYHEAATARLERVYQDLQELYVQSQAEHRRTRPRARGDKVRAVLADVLSRGKDWLCARSPAFHRWCERRARRRCQALPEQVGHVQRLLIADLCAEIATLRFLLALERRKPVPILRQPVRGQRFSRGSVLH